MSDESTNNMALQNPPENLTYGTTLLACSMDGHHDDAWRHDCAAWKWSMSDVGDCVWIRTVVSDYPHDDDGEMVNLIVPARLIEQIAAGSTSTAPDEKSDQQAMARVLSFVHVAMNHTDLHPTQHFSELDLDVLRKLAGRL